MSKEEKKQTENSVSESVNEQITNLQNIGEAPAIALGSIYQNATHSTGIMFENAINNQNQQYILQQAASTQGIMQIYSINTVTDAISIAQILNPNAHQDKKEK